MAQKKKTFVKKEDLAPEELEKNGNGKRHFLRLGRNGLLVLIALILIIVVLGAFLYTQGTSVNSILQNTQTSQQQTQNLIQKVGDLMLLPTNETPQVATVTDVSKLSGQPFFARAQNGDKVLIYQNAAEVILYRPGINKIIAVAPLNAPTSSQSASQTLTPTPTQVQDQTATAVILNGTAATGLARTAETKIKASLANIKVLSVGDSYNSYQQTEVIDVSGKKSQAASQVASFLGGKVVSAIPAGEDKPNADILVILGSDYTGK